MAASEAHRQQWQRRWAAASATLRQQWPALSTLWLFGSVLTEAFAAHSNIDLALEGLPPQDRFAAMALCKHSGSLAVDLVRLESLLPQSQQRIGERGRLG